MPFRANTLAFGLTDLSIRVNVLFNPTFGQLTVLGGLTGGQDGLDENADAPLRRISAADDREAEGLAAVTLLEDDGVEGG